MNMQSSSDINTQAWPLRRVGLRVHDLATSVDYYTRLGFSIVRDERDQGTGGGVGLGVGTQEILSLRPLPGGHPRSSRTAGLYHFALLLPGEVELGSFLQHAIDQQIPLEGASDHLVSQALYLSDPEGNGIEVYADRPASDWTWQDGQVGMGLDPLDIEGLMRDGKGVLDGFPADSRLGHMHLTVGEVGRAAD